MRAAIFGLLALIAGLLLVPRSHAEYPLGDAGPFREWGWADCGKTLAVQMAGGCDPVPVDTALDGEVLAKARRDRALVLLALGRLDELREEMGRAIAEDPNNLAALKLRARASISEEDWVRATADIQRGLSISPNDADLLANLAYLQLAQPEMALKTIDAALAAKPDSVDALWIRAWAFDGLGKKEEEQADLDRALKIEPDQARVTLTRAQVRLQLGKFQQAMEDADRVLSKEPNASAYRLRAMAKAALHDDAGALEDLTQSLKSTGEVGSRPAKQSDDANMLRVMLLARLGHEEEARGALDSIVRQGGSRKILQLKLIMRRNGINVPLDDEWTPDFEKGLHACFLQSACGMALSVGA